MNKNADAIYRDHRNESREMSRLVYLSIALVTEY